MTKPNRLHFPILQLVASLLVLAAFTAGPLHAAPDKKILQELFSKAEAGDAEAQFQLGQHLSYKTDLAISNPGEAEQWYTRAAKQDHLGAILGLIELFDKFPNLVASADEFAGWLKRGADLGHAGTSVKLGILLWSGASGLDSDRPAAYARLRTQAILGNESAALFLADRAQNGNHVKRDPAAARRLLQWAARHDSIEAELRLLVITDKDRKFETLPLLGRRLEKLGKSGNPRAFTALGRAYERGLPMDTTIASESMTGRLARAREYYEKASDLGDAEAMTRLGIFFAKGFAGTPQPKEARQLFEKAAAAGQSLAQLNLAVMMLEESAPAGGATRIRELLEAAAATEPGANFELGLMSYEGNQTARDVKLAAQYFEKAARAGHPAAMANLGVIAAKGETGPADIYSANKWWTKAFLGGSSDGANFLTRFGDRVSAADRTKIAQELRDERAAALQASSAGWVDLELNK